MTVGLLAPLLGYLATLLPKAADEVAMSPIKQGVKSMYGDNKKQGLVAAPPQQAPGLAGQMQQQPIPMPEAIPTNTPGIYGPMGSSHLEPATGLHGEGPGPDPLNSPMRQPPMMRGDPANSLASMVTLNPPQPQQGLMQQGHQNTDEGHSHRHPQMSALGDALVLYGQMTSPNGDPKAALQMIQQRRQAQAQAQMQAAEVAREQANRREDITRETRQFDVNTGLKQDQLKQGAEQFAASEEDKRLTREAQAKQAAADNALNTGKLDLERTNAANENQYRQGMLANAQAETKQKQQQAAMSSLFTTQIMARMGLLPHDAPQQVALMHDTAQANNPGQPGMGTPQPQQTAMEQPQQQPGQQDYLDQLHEYGLSDAQIATAAMAKDPGRALNDAINTSRTVSGEKTMNEETAKSEVERNTKLQTSADAAANQNAILNVQESLINDAFSGRFANNKAAFFNALSSAGIPVSEEMKGAAGATEAAATMGRQMVMAKLGNLGRNISDADVRMTLGMFADPKNTQIGNKMLFKVLRASNQRDIDLQQLATHLRHDNKGHLPDDWEQRVQNYDETHKAALHSELTAMAPSAGGSSGDWNSTQGGVKYRIVQ